MSHYIVLVADEARARFFMTQSRTGALTEIDALVNPDARLREQDLVSDSRGGNPHDIGNHGEVHARIADSFAKQVGQSLGKAVAKYRPDSIHVAAAPRFLGMLRKHWSDGIQSDITQELPKDLTQLSPDQVRAHLPEYL